MTKEKVYFSQKKKVDPGPCAPLRSIRTLNMGGNIEQRPWTPTVRTGRIAAETATPGPAIVQLPTLIGSKVPDSKKKGAPSYSFGHKLGSKYETFGPGPAQYNVTGLRSKGKDYPRAATLQSRPKELSRFSNPGPGEYNVQPAAKAVIDATPMYTFGQKPPDAKFSLIPAPNVYKIPTVLGSSKEGKIRSAPAYTMAGREKPPLIPALVMPGPGYYDGEFTAIKPKPPVYTMRGKYKLVGDDAKPGPGAHCPEKYWEKRSTPAISFGIMHSPFAGEQSMHLIPERYVQCLLANRPDKGYL
ncbi:outer dense fiber protein 3 [Drosophila madeirensis]|uniref:Outer dense fiber protein 3 n=1 Tax=Drosophila madeirensis TaxID=30013 RepID=A0AAU9FJ00_DROMD